MNRITKAIKIQRIKTEVNGRLDVNFSCINDELGTGIEVGEEVCDYYIINWRTISILNFFFICHSIYINLIMIFIVVYCNSITLSAY